MKRSAWVVVVLAVALVAIALWWRTDGAVASDLRESVPSGVVEGAAAANTRAPGSAPLGSPTTGPQAVAPPPGPPLGQPEAPARTVSGLVTFDGAPVAGARVRLESSGNTHHLPATVTTGADGRFAFGPQPAMSFVVSARTEGRSAASETLDLRDPASKSSDVELRLTGCADRLLGTVFDPEGGVIVGARLRPVASVGVETGSDGAYALCLPRGFIRLRVDADGYGPMHTSTTVLGDTRFDVVLAPEAIIVGRVIDASTTQPVPFAVVTVRPLHWGQVASSPVTGVSNAQGNFRIGVAPGTHRVGASAVGLSTRSPVEVSVAVGKESSPLTLVLVSTSEVRGRVVSAGKPVPGVTVTFSSPGTWLQAVSQVDGRFVLQGLVSGEYKVGTEPWALAKPVSLRVVKPVETLELEVKRQATVRGTVTRLGKPVAQASVMVMARGHQMTTYTSDNDGRYEAKGLAAGDWSIAAQNERVGAFMAPRPITVQADQDQVVDLELDLAGSISGTVRDEAGQPVPGVLVIVSLGKDGDMGQGLTDAAGAFRCPALSGGGDYVPRVYPSATSRTAFKPVKGEVFPGVPVPNGASQVEGVELAIQNERFEVSGRAVDAQGEPVPDVRVSAAPEEGTPANFSPWRLLPSAITDTRGAFTIARLTSGMWALQAKAPEGGEAVLEHVKAGSQGVVLTLQAKSGIDGTLSGFKAAAVYGQPADGQPRFERAVVSGESFQLDVPPGAWLISAAGDGEGDVKRVEVKPGARASVSLVNRGSGELRGVVTEFKTQAPVAGLRCDAVTAAGSINGINDASPESLPQSDAQGSFVLKPAPAGEVHVTCFSMAQDYSVGIALTSVPAGGQGAVAVQVVRHINLSGDIGVTLPRFGPSVVVVAVRPGSPAALQGVRPGDVVTAIDGDDVSRLGTHGVETVIANHLPGSALALTVVRGAQPRTFRLTVMQKP